MGHEPTGRVVTLRSTTASPLTLRVIPTPPPQLPQGCSGAIFGLGFEGGSEGDMGSKVGAVLGHQESALTE